jgi:hypothetical protein
MYMEPPVEPHRLKLWRSPRTGQTLYTSARPGRGSQGKHGNVSDELVKKWFGNLPGSGDITIVSLLGRKPNGSSEFRFYTFHGLWDSGIEREGKPSFVEWIRRHDFGRSITVIEHPTTDQDIPPETVTAIAADIGHLLDRKACVLLIDSGGCTRTGQVCKHMGFDPAFTEDTQ